MGNYLVVHPQYLNLLYCVDLEEKNLPLGAVVTTVRNIETRTRNKVTNKPALSPPFKGIRKLIHETTTNIADGIMICKR